MCDSIACDRVLQTKANLMRNFKAWKSSECDHDAEIVALEAYLQGVEREEDAPVQDVESDCCFRGVFIRGRARGGCPCAGCWVVADPPTRSIHHALPSTPILEMHNADAVEGVENDVQDGQV
ncbi:hypothetical protein ACOSP7_026570 [Xanthoceras sorbifolium]